MPWVAAPDEAMLSRVAAALDHAGRSGALLVGPDGVGKTLLARTAAEKFAAQRTSTAVRWVRGTPSERMVPFGAFGRLVHSPVFEADIGRPAALLRAAHDSLLADRDLLFVIDDAHDLDSLSATLVYQLALKRSARLIVTARSETELPDAVAALSADDLLARIEVGPLDAAQTTALLESAPDMSAAAADEVFACSRGNPLYLRHLVEGDHTGDRTAPLSALIDGYLRGLPPPVLAMLDYLAVAQPLRRSDLVALAGEGAVADGETRGAIASDEFGQPKGDGVRGPSALRRTRPSQAFGRHRAGAAHRGGRAAVEGSVRSGQRPAANCVPGD